MSKAAKVGGGLGFLALGVMLFGLLLWMFGRGSGELAAPRALLEKALQGTPEQQEQAVLDLGRFVPPQFPATDPRVQEAKECLRQLLGSSTVVPLVRANAIQALGTMKDRESLPQLLEALDDNDVQVRCRAGAAVTRIIGMDFFYDGTKPPEERKIATEKMRELGKSDYEMFKRGKLK
jgi:hypothetical protein